MRRLCKKGNSVAGFTLTEMVIVIGIIVIIASVVGYGIFDTINRARNVGDAVDNSVESFKNFNNASESLLSLYKFG